MEPRLNVFANEFAARAFVKPFREAGRVLASSSLPTSTAELVKLRASQINGCSFCVDMHFKEAVAAGESPERLNMVGAWREATVFTEAERAALELAEQATRIADGGVVTDEAWQAAQKHYDEEQLIALVGVIALINAYNRINATVRTPGGSYRVGQFREKSE